MVYNNKQSSFEKLLEKDSSVSIHDRNIQYLTVEMYKLATGYFHLLSTICLSTKIVISQYETRFSVFMGQKAYLI